ncbi:MAG: hypothetical protein HQL76_09945 [Magnetococcales bacterium]|nr:hypothetical protein [Magnetococcales bacterium]
MGFLSELELDLLAEAFNIGLGSGSAALSELLGEEIHVTVPSVHILPKRAAIDLCAARFDFDAHTIRQSFVDEKNAHGFSGEAFLIVSQVSSRNLASMLCGSEVSEIDVLAELGNLLLHACLSSLADMIETEFDSKLPEVHLHRAADLLIEISRAQGSQAMTMTGPNEQKRRPVELQDKVLQLVVEFRSASREIAGEVMLFLDISKLPDLKGTIGRAVHRLLFQREIN